MIRETSATAIYVAYRTPHLDLDWLPEEAEVVVVHNDRALDPASIARPRVTHLYPSDNVGFGAAVNLAAAEAKGTRLVLCNPDTDLRPDHWGVLTRAEPTELVTVPIVDDQAHDTSVVNSYPTPFATFVTGYRLGRLIPRSSPWRRRLAPLGGGWSRQNASSFTLRSGRWPLSDRWVSGALFSIDRQIFLSAGGFDSDYFLYFEDVDLCRRLARDHQLALVLADASPAVHHVGSSRPPGRAGRVVDQHHVRSARRYARSQPGFAWSLAAWALGPRQWWVDR